MFGRPASPVIDPSLSSSSTPSSSLHLPLLPMPHRIEPYPSMHRYDRRPSPPPIATLTHPSSPSPSVSSLDNRSAVGTPPIRRTPPAQPQHYVYYDTRPPYLPPPIPHPHHPRDYHPHPLSLSSYPPAPTQIPQSNGTPASIIYTEDASTKLSDRVRRRCFNCCTTDTSTWRRSNLSPGKVLCNKCGLFERTHSRPRPEQFPHKRGALASAVQQSPSAPTTTTSGTQSQGRDEDRLPPISSSYSYHHHPHHHHHHHQHPQPPPPQHHERYHHHLGDDARSSSSQYQLPHLSSWHSEERKVLVHTPPPPPPPASASASAGGQRASSAGGGGGGGGGASPEGKESPRD